jgi:long-chain acyl-CoA synthetase
MSGHQGQERVFHYTPFAFAAAWIMLLTCLSRGTLLMLNTDLSKIATDIPAAAPHYFVNVPLLLERVRRGIDEQLLSRGGVALTVYTQAKTAWTRLQSNQSHFGDGLRLRVANKLLFPTLRKKVVGTNLKALICGSAPLNADTQLFFAMLGIPVLQVYGLTETTAICTMDDPARVEPGRVGPAIPRIEMKLDEGDEIVVRGANIFSGYWNRPDETAKAIRDGWFHTGDQGEMNAAGNWRIIGRVKNLLVLASAHGRRTASGTGREWPKLSLRHRYRGGFSRYGSGGD